MSSIQWPAVLHYSGLAELGYIRDSSEWDAQAKLHHTFQHNDRLIDSTGAVFKLAIAKQPQLTTQTITLDELIVLIQQHAAHAGMCCVAKFSAASIEEAVHIIGTLDASA